MPEAVPPAVGLVIFDLDGVVYLGDQPIPGAAALARSIRSAGILVRFATNNSMATREQYVTRLAAHEIAAVADEIVTSTSATVDHLRAHLPGVQRVMTVGAAGMADEFRSGGYTVTAATDAAPVDYDGGPLAEAYDAVVAGLDPAIDFRRLAIASTAIRAGALFIATNADARYPTPHGFVPGAGSIVAALRAAGGADPLIIGKPEPAMFQAILQRAGVSPGDALAIGDNPDADMVAAHRAGIRSVLVLTGVADRATADGLEGERHPDAVADGPAAVARLLGLELS